MKAIWIVVFIAMCLPGCFTISHPSVSSGSSWSFTGYEQSSISVDNEVIYEWNNEDGVVVDRRSEFDDNSRLKAQIESHFASLSESE